MPNPDEVRENNVEYLNAIVVYKFAQVMFFTNRNKQLSKSECRKNFHISYQTPTGRKNIDTYNSTIKVKTNFNDNELRDIYKNFNKEQQFRIYKEFKLPHRISKQWREYLDDYPAIIEPFDKFKIYYEGYIIPRLEAGILDKYGYFIKYEPIPKTEIDELKKALDELEKKAENKVQETKQLPQEIIDSRNKVLEQLKPKPENKVQETKQLPQEIIDSRNKVLEQLKPKSKSKPKTKSNGSNKWVEHVRAYAKANNISYACAISEASKTYRK
jgi:hypothetical protein